MTKEELFLIKILNDFINKKDKTELFNGLNLKRLYDLGKRHEVIGIIYYQTKKEQFFKSYAATIYSNMNKKNMLKQLFSEFEFPYFIVKGFEVSKFYPIPNLRTMGDIDIVVHEKDQEKAHKIFLKQGYSNITKSEIHEWIYIKKKNVFELHNSLVYSESINNLKQDNFFMNAWSFVEENELDWNFHFLYLIYHLKRHFMNKGVGLRQFMDIAIVIKYVNLDWEWIENEAEKIEMLSFTKIVLSFCRRWFEIDLPIDTPTLEDEFYECSMRKILKDGLFGFDNEENNASSGANAYIFHGKKEMIHLLIKHIFPSYKILCEVPFYSFVKGRRYLVPFVWIYRFFRKRDISFVKEINKKYAKEDQIIERENLYKQWRI